MNRGGGQIRGALYNFFVVKKCLFCIFQMYYNRFIKSFHEQVCLIIFNGRYYFDRYFSPPPSPFTLTPLSAAMGLTLEPNFQKGSGLDRTSTCRWGLLGQRGVTFFKQGGVQFSHKNKLKSEIFNNEKNQKQKYFSVIQTGKSYLRIQ